MKIRRPVDLGPLGGLLFLLASPVLVPGALIWCIAAMVISRWRESRVVQRLRDGGRFLDWTLVEQHLLQGEAKSPRSFLVDPG